VGGCTVYYDLHATPNVTSIVTPSVAAGEALSVVGRGLDVGAVVVTAKSREDEDPPDARVLLQREAQSGVLAVESIPCAIHTEEDGGRNVFASWQWTSFAQKQFTFGCRLPEELPAIAGTTLPRSTLSTTPHAPNPTAPYTRLLQLV
jgi:hypothetical protein